MPTSAAAPLCIRPSISSLGPVDSHEVYRGQVFHDGLLWEGHCSGAFPEYRLDAHAADGTVVVASAHVPHTLEFLYPFAPRTILVVGKHFHPRRGWLTHHSIVRFEAPSRHRPGRLHVDTRTMPRHLQVEQFGGCPRAMFFNEPGARKVIRWNGWWGRPLRPVIHLPGAMVHCGHHLFVLERNDLRPGNETVLRIDLRTEQAERTFPCPRRRITALVDLPDTPWIAATEAWADQVLLIDKRVNRLAATLSVPGMPVDLAPFGHGLAVFAADARRVSFFDLEAPSLPLVAEWDLSALDRGSAHHRAMHVDPVSGSLFLRSAFHPSVDSSAAAVRKVVDPGGQTLHLCTRGNRTTTTSGLGPAAGRGAA